MIKKVVTLPILYSIALAVWIHSFVYAQEINPVLIEATAKRDKAVQLAREGNTREALPLMEDALRLYGEKPEFRYDHIVILSWAEKHSQVIKNFEALPDGRVIPDYVLPQIAASYRRVGEYDKAIQQYKEYLTRKPKDQETIRAIAYCYLDAGKTEEAIGFINGMKKEYPAGTTMLKSLYADVLFQKGDSEKALQLYAEAFRDNPEDTETQLGIIRVVIAQGRGADVARSIDAILEKDPYNYVALICKGEILEAEKKFIEAYGHYERALAMYPHSKVIIGLRYRALMHLGSTSLVKELLEANDEEFDLTLRAILAGDEAMARIRWDEPRQALDIIQRNELEMSMIRKQNPAQGYFRDALFRSYYDGLESLRMQEYMTKTVRQYDMLKSIGTAIPPWTLVQAADAYLYLQHPEEALVSYHKALKENWDPEGSTRMSIYYTLVELGRFKEAESMLDSLDKDTPAQIVLRGVLRDNWVKEDIALNRGWCLLYQDRLAEAQEYLLDYLYNAPANTNIRSTLAQAYLWRGWPRLALQEFQISHNIDEKNVANDIGTTYALDENDRGKEARAQAKKLIALYPTNKHVQQANRYFNIKDMRTLTINAEYATEDPGADGITWSARIDQPIFPWRSIFAEYLWRSNHDSDNHSLNRRYLLGTDWRLTRDWWFTGGMSFDHDGGDAGHFESLTLTPDDYWLFNAGYDSDIVNLPLRAAANDISADQFSLRARFRASESLISETWAGYNDFSDRNDRMTYGIKIDTALTTAAYWQTRLALEGSAETNSKTNHQYFSPGRLYSFYIVPMVEHTWFRRYERALVDRFYLGLGGQWQEDYGSDELWYVRYEIDQRMSDLWSLLIGTTYSKKHYDGKDTNVWTSYLTFKRYF